MRKDGDHKQVPAMLIHIVLKDHPLDIAGCQDCFEAAQYVSDLARQRLGLPRRERR
jgi:hypothetical protein